MILSRLTDEELLREAANADPLTTSDLQTELAKRFGALIDEHDAMQSLLDDIAAPSDSTQRADVETALDLVREFPHRDISGLLGLLSEYDLDNPEALAKVLERDHDLQSLLDDLADPIAKLHGLANPTPAAAPATPS